MEPKRIFKPLLMKMVLLAAIFINITIELLAGVCDVTKANGGGFTTSIQSVVCNPGGTSYTVILRVYHNGCGGTLCKELSHYSVEADPGTYSNISVAVVFGGMTYTNIVLGPNLGSSTPFQGFKIDGIDGIGGGQSGSFTITYTLTNLQDQQVSAKAGTNLQLAAFSVTDFNSVMICNNTGCGSLTGPDAVNDNAITFMNLPVNIPVLSNDIAGSGAIIPSSLTFVTGTVPLPSVGVFSLGSSGTVIFTPANNYTGIATIDYRVCDFNNLCDVATITVTINGGGGGGGDSDGDGCPDDADEYPADPTRCFNNYFPANGTGTLAFEDLWPGQGDYDFNDLVCDYRFTLVTNGENKVVEIFGTFITKAFGASFENGFGFQFPNSNVNPATMTVTGFDLQEGYISLAANGTETGQEKPTIILYDNAYNLMPFPGQGIGVNTTPGAPYVDPDTMNIKILFTPALYTIAQIDLPNFNPFIIVNRTRGLEVHLPDYPPTSLADPGYFGQAQDDTDPTAGKYYKTINNLPWAINIYESFSYPKEKSDIVKTYNHFAEWVLSSGTQYPDWYQDKPGYRNQSNIY